ncbi:hypothetical protein Q9L58_010299, partial [Maublancomyces gigas]
MAWVKWAVGTLDGMVGALGSARAGGTSVGGGEVVTGADSTLWGDGVAFGGWVSEGLALSALGGGEDLEVEFQA